MRGFARGACLHYNSAMATQAGRKQGKRRSDSNSTWGDENSTFEWEFDTGAPADAAQPRPERRPAALPPLRPSSQGPEPEPKQQEPVAGVAFETPHPVSPLAAKYAGSDGLRRARSVAQLLDAALERWWRLGEVAGRGLLREGLLVLEAGHDLDGAQRTLLLRSALAHGTGQLTALHYQTDPERVALVIQEAALIWDPPLPAATVAWLAVQDPRWAEWCAPLIHDLQTVAAAAAGVQRERAEALLAALDGRSWEGEILGRAPEPAGQPGAAGAVRSRWGVAAALALVVGGLIWWQMVIHRPLGMVEVPPGSYLARDPALDADRRVALDGFLIDRFEVANREYRRCYARGDCPWPSSIQSATRPNYFLERAFAGYPVVNLDHAAAAAYCRWAGKRLPTAEEWEVAAGYAPATNRQYRYPWGELFEPQRANSAAAGLGDTVAVGSYHPAGDSPLGASEMAGNVAEWTSTQAQQGEQAGYVVKGGSFLDGPDRMRASAQMVLAGEQASAWVGLRCARTLLLDRQ